MPALELPEQQLALPDHTELTYVEIGFGKVTLLVHGSLCDYRYWRWQMAALAEYGRVVAPSLRGYWPNVSNTPNNRFSVRQHALDLVELIRRLSPDQPVQIIGHSRGAHVAMEMAIEAPELIDALVLADPGLNAAGVPQNSAFLQEATRAIAAGHIEEGLATFIDAVSGNDTWRRMTGWFKTMIRDNAPTLLSQIREADTLYDLGRAQKITCPVLLLGGSQSPKRYTKIMDALAPRLGNVQRDTIAMASHGMNLANPKSFNRKVLGFFSGETPAAPDAST